MVVTHSSSTQEKWQVENGPPTYQKAMTKTFKGYLDNFMKIFYDDFMVYSDMESHL
jgi:hypothetical protein